MFENPVLEQLIGKPTKEMTNGEFIAYTGYRATKEGGCDVLKTSNLTHMQDGIGEFLDVLRNAGVDKFVITERATNLIEVLYELEMAGCTIEGTTVLKVQYVDWLSPDHEIGVVISLK